VDRSPLTAVVSGISVYTARIPSQSVAERRLNGIPHTNDTTLLQLQLHCLQLHFRRRGVRRPSL